MCGARYKTRPGLTYHYTHSHKDRGSGAVTGDEEVSSEAPPSSPSANPTALHPPVQDKGTDPASVQGWTKFQDSYLTFLNTPGTRTLFLVFKAFLFLVHLLFYDMYFIQFFGKKFLKFLLCLVKGLL